MALTLSRYKERILLTFTEAGDLRGASVRHVEQLMDGATPLGPPKMTDPAPIEPADLATLLPAAASAIAQVSVLQAQCAAHDAAIAAAAAERDEALANAAAAYAARAAAEDAAAASELARSSESASHAAAVAAAVAAAADAHAAAMANAGARIAELEAQLAGPTQADAMGFPVLSAVQVRLGLLAAGISPGQVAAVLSAIPDPVERETALTHWDYATEYHRGHPLTLLLSSALGLSSEAVDAMWLAAASQ